MDRFWRRLAVAQVRRPGAFLVIGIVFAALGVWRAARLRLVTDFADLLPQNQPSVVELRRILTRVRGLSNIHIALEGADPATLRRASDVLLPRLRAIGGPYVESARNGVQEERRFLLPRAGLYLSDADVDDLDQRLAAQERQAYRKGIGADLDDDEDAAKTAPLTADDIQRRLLAKTGALDRFPEGYYQGGPEDNFTQVIVVKAAIAAGDVGASRDALERVRAVVDATLAAEGLSSTVRAGYAGDLLTSMAEYDLVRRDVLDVGLFGLCLVLAVVVIFFRTPAALLALGATVGVGCAVTFGLTEVVLGHLNVATAFLFSIVAGNGINFGIIWLARFLEERRTGRSLVRATSTALRRTYGATLTAAGAAATAYAALGIGRFRGFRHFALIGGCGMLICWLASYLLLPAVVVLLERRKRLSRHMFRATSGGVPFTPFERPVVWLVEHATRPTLIVALVVTVGAGVATARYFKVGPLEYNMNHLESDKTTTGDLYRVSHLADRVLSNKGSSAGMVVLTDDERDTPVVASLLRKKRDEAPPTLKPFQEVHTLEDLVPPNQEQRLARLRKLTRRLERAHDRGGIDDATWARITPMLPPPDLQPFAANDLPKQLVEPFTEKDGTRGRILYVEPTVGQSDHDLHYLLRFADAFRSTTLPDGRIVHGSGRAVIFADLLRASLVDMPRSVMLSLGLTCIVVTLLFRRPRSAATVLGSLALALLWMLGALGALGVRLSFINFIALPVTFGIGIDYAVNVYGRYEQDRRAGIIRALTGSGGAVILCSLTTSLGYLALLRAHNQAVRSLGAVAVLGEAACLTTAVLVLPAAIVWWSSFARRAVDDNDQGAAVTPERNAS
jgi:predicted RND superfamily exporter protein